MSLLLFNCHGIFAAHYRTAVVVLLLEPQRTFSCELLLYAPVSKSRLNASRSFSVIGRNECSHGRHGVTVISSNTNSTACADIWVDLEFIDHEYRLFQSSIGVSFFPFFFLSLPGCHCEIKAHLLPNSLTQSCSYLYNFVDNTGSSFRLSCLPDDLNLARVINWSKFSSTITREYLLLNMFEINPSICNSAHTNAIVHSVLT